MRRPQATGLPHFALLRTSWLLTAEEHPTQLVAETLRFFRVAFAAETLGQSKEFLLLSFLRFNPVLDEFQQHAVGA